MNERWKLSPERFLNAQELTALLRRAEELRTLGIARKRPQLIRDWMIIQTFTFTGLRRSEVCDLRCIDFRIFGGHSYLVVRRGKGGRSRHVHLPRGYKKDVRWYLRWKRERGELDDPEAFFLRTERSEMYSPSGIYKRFKKYCPSHRLHDMRHTTATNLLAAGQSLRLTQLVLGHASLTSTQVYLGLTATQSVAGMDAMERLVKSGSGRRGLPSTQHSA